MTHLETQLQQLKDSTYQMMSLCRNQIAKSKLALLERDKDLCNEIIVDERQVNAYELRIDRDCENIFALYNPVASDLRFVIATINIISDLERIGDHAEGLALYVSEFQKPFDIEFLNNLQVEAMFDTAINMLNLLMQAYDEENTKLVAKIFAEDKFLNKMKSDSTEIITEYLKATPEMTRQALFLFSTIRKLERVGDLSKNISEQIVFYSDAEVIKHNNKKKLD